MARTASAMSLAAISRYTSVLDSKQILRRQHHRLEGGCVQCRVPTCSMSWGSVAFRCRARDLFDASVIAGD
jgi:hypothetical protein